MISCRQVESNPAKNVQVISQEDFDKIRSGSSVLKGELLSAV